MDDSPERGTFARRVCVAVGIVALAVALLALLWHATEVLLLAFAAVLVAVFLRGLGHALCKRTPLSETWALAIVITVLLLVAAAGAWILAPQVAAQADQLSQSLTESFQKLGAQLSRYGWGQRLLAEAPGFSELTRRANLLSQVTGVFSTTLALLANTIVVIFLGLYLAFQPGLYTRGIVRLFPKAKRPRMTEVLDETGETLQRWLVGRAILMVANGALTALGLWLLGIPMPFTLGILAGLLNFVPNIGPILAGIPAVLIAWTQGQALAVFALYFVLQMADGYIFTPLVQQRTVALAPALTILAQVLFGVLAGSLGLLLATPLTAAALVLVRRLYLEDVLGDHGDRARQDSTSRT